MNPAPKLDAACHRTLGWRAHAIWPRMGQLLLIGALVWLLVRGWVVVAWLAAATAAAVADAWLARRLLARQDDRRLLGANRASEVVAAATFSSVAFILADSRTAIGLAGAVLLSCATTLNNAVMTRGASRFAAFIVGPPAATLLAIPLATLASGGPLDGGSAVLLTLGAAAYVVFILRLASTLRGQGEAMSQAITALEAADARYRRIAENVNDMILESADGRVVYTSPACERLLGFSVDELIGAEVASLIHPHDVDSVVGALKDCVARRDDGRGLKLEYRVRTKAGGWIWVESRPRICLNAEGECVSVEDVIRDIGERRLASEALVASELKHRLLAERIHDLVVQYDADGIIQYVSPSARRFGYEPEDVVGRSVESFELPEFWEKTRSDLAAYRAGRPFPEGAKTNTTLRLPDGGLACIEGIQSGVYDADGAFAGVLTVQRDVTERMALQADLQQSETRYRLLAEHSPDIIVRYDIAGRLEYVSPAARRYAFEPHELVGRDIGELIHPDEEARSDAYLAGVLSDEEERQGPDVWRIRLPDGEFVSFEGASVGIHDAEGRVTGAVAVLRDVSQRLQLEAELRSKRLEAEAATVAKSEFLANMSHEIRTPLTGVVGFAGLLESMEGLPPAALRYANRISTCAETLVAVVNDVLDFSKLEAGRMELDPHPFDPRELVETAADLVGDRARKKGLEIAVCIKAGHPERLIGDSARLRQVLLNLLTNAVKFTDQGSVRVEARFDAASGLLRVAVADTGVGVPPELADRLFQRFSQVDASSTRVFGGTGLGLAISRALIEMMGGRIGFERNEGQGSTFWLEVPAQPAPEEARVAPPSLSEETVEAMRLLLVDDVAMNRELVSTMLSAFDVDIAQAGSGPEAVKAAMARQFDVILMDVQMPGMDGMAATRAIRANSELNRSTPILAISANVLPEQVAACRDAGMNDHVAKPIDPAELLTKLMRWSPGQLETA